MTPDDLRALLEHLTQGPVVPTGVVRHVYLWHGDPDALTVLVPAALRQPLDLYALAQRLPRTPYALDEAQHLLRTEIEGELQCQKERAPSQVLIVSGCGLLARYRVPLQPFHAFASDRRVVILTVSRQDSEFAPTASLPEFTHLDQTATLTALRVAVGEQNIVQG